MTKNLLGLSFVIPAKNEEKHIAETLIAIKENVPNEPYEIIR